MQVSWLRLFPLFCRSQYLERAHEALVHAHHGTGVIELPAVVGGREESHQASLGEKLVAVFDDLVGTADEVEVVLFQKVLHHCGAERVRHASVVGGPHWLFPIRIGPQEVTEQAGFWHITRPNQASDLVHVVEFRRESAVHAENFLVYDGGDGHAVEALREDPPQSHCVPPLALVVEAVDAVDGGAFVVAAQEEEVLRVLDLVGQEQADGLQALAPAVDVVAEEQVVGLRREAAVLEQTQQVVVLSVDVAANLDRRFQLNQDRL
mmetsp:Transcript_41627/g.61077  ORF Transcript_41627/g.61077 Transcript_41627/m.61077 type:complete len:264 (+) Transcript_41627:174-965(+)